MPRKPIRGKAVDLLSRWCDARIQISKRQEKALQELGGRVGRSLLETQIRYLDIAFRRANYEPYRTISKFLGRKDFRRLLREALKRRSRRGVVSLTAWCTPENIVDAIYLFAKKYRKFGSRASVLERALKDKSLKEELIETIAEKVISFSNAQQYRAMMNRMIELMQSIGMKNPVIIDYGTGIGASTKQLKTMLKGTGINANIIATDKLVLPEARDKFKETDVALVQHNLAKGSYLSKYKKADVAILGSVLPYTARENVNKIIRNVMRDVKLGGLIAVGGARGKFTIYKKISRTEVELLAL